MQHRIFFYRGELNQKCREARDTARKAWNETYPGYKATLDQLNAEAKEKRAECRKRGKSDRKACLKEVKKWRAEGIKRL